MSDEADDHFQRVLDLSDRLATLSEAGFSCFDHEGCLLLNGIVRDCAFRLRDAAEVERKVHRRQAQSRTGGETIHGERSTKSESFPLNWARREKKETHYEGA